jgi:2TM domain
VATESNLVTIVARARATHGSADRAERHDARGRLPLPARQRRGDASGMTKLDPADGMMRERAIKRLKKRRDLGAHVLVYLLVNSFIIAIWFVTNDGGFFWPVFPIGGWGIGLVMNAYDVFRSEDFDEDTIRREMHRLQRR